MIQYFPIVTGSLTVLGNINVSGSITTSGSITISGSITSASFATSASNATNAISASYANNLTVAGTLTAQTIVVQTITSSVDYITGSSINGSKITDTHQFTGSMLVTGSATFSSTILAGQGTFQSTGANIISKNTTTSQANLIRYDNSSGTARAYLGYESTNSDFYIDNGEGKILNYVSGGLSLTLNADKSATFASSVTAATKLSVGTSSTLSGVDMWIHSNSSTNVN